MTLALSIRAVAMSLRAQATVLDDGPATALRAQARALEADRG